MFLKLFTAKCEVECSECLFPCSNSWTRDCAVNMGVENKPLSPQRVNLSKLEVGIMKLTCIMQGNSHIHSHSPDDPPIPLIWTYILSKSST